ncbi:DUF2905 domain-containing protein [Lunatibacter salilacus]|uniref:DUF2905 domain-containing protein n=1 Tax=Lunatibacter salilacus TaxID=2483804 RepID=UPI0018FE9F4D|nr:DUF2905 domain-containing protein [Lunatibacter salilacus]
MDNGLPAIAKLLIFAGLLLVAIGLLLWGWPKMTDWKSLPGDIVVKRENFTFYFPLGTSIIISLLLTLLVFLWRKYNG